jgi:membrane associated rhomboid family serine protease
MRRPAHHEPRLSWTAGLLIANAVVFLMQLAASNSPGAFEFEGRHLALSLDGLRSGQVWQFLTFQFLHAGWMHILFNSLTIFFFGRSVETAYGHVRFLTLYLSSGIIGGVVQMLFALALPEHFGGSVIGASAGACGLIAAFAVLKWEEPFTIILYFVPVTMRGKTLFWISLALAVVGIFTLNSSIANAAHLGGMLAGFFYVRQIIQGRWPQWRFPARREDAPRSLVATKGNQGKFWRSPPATPDQSSDEDFLQREVDPILDKISAHGIQSLTARERETLEKARAKMAKR